MLKNKIFEQQLFFDELINKCICEMSGSAYFDLLLNNSNDMIFSKEATKMKAKLNTEKYFVELLSISPLENEIIQFLKKTEILKQLDIKQLNDEERKLYEFYSSGYIYGFTTIENTFMQKITMNLFFLYKIGNVDAKIALRSILINAFNKNYKILRKFKTIKDEDILSISDENNLRFKEKVDYNELSDVIRNSVINTIMSELLDLEIDDSIYNIHFNISALIKTDIQSFKAVNALYYDISPKEDDDKISSEFIYVKNKNKKQENDNAEIFPLDSKFLSIYKGKIVLNEETNIIEFINRSTNEKEQITEEMELFYSIIQSICETFIEQMGYDKDLLNKKCNKEFEKYFKYILCLIIQMAEDKGLIFSEIKNIDIIKITNLLSAAIYILSKADKYVDITKNMIGIGVLDYNQKTYDNLMKYYSMNNKYVEKLENKKSNIDKKESQITPLRSNDKESNMDILLQEKEEELQRLKQDLSYMKELYENKKESYDVYVKKYTIAETEHEELIKLREYLYNMNEDNETEKKYTKDNKDVLQDMIDYLKEKTIIIVGGHQNWTGKLKELFPKWKFMTPNSKNAINVTNCDYVFFFNEYLKHTTYYKCISIIRDNNAPFGYIRTTNIDANIRDIYRQCTSCSTTHD